MERATAQLNSNMIPPLYDAMVITEMTSLTRAVDADLNMQVVSTRI